MGAFRCAHITVAIAVLVALGVSSPVAAAHHRSACERAVQDSGRCDRVTVFGHRGRQWRTDTNENTLYAFRLDAKVGASFEADTWVLADGTPVVFHDRTLGRVVDPMSMPSGVTSKTRITDLTLEQYRQLRTKGGWPLLTLERLLKFSGERRVSGIIENKYGLLDPAQVSAWVHQYHARVAFYETPKCQDGQLVPPAFPEYGVRVGAKYIGGCRPSPRHMAAAGFSFLITAGDTITRSFVHHAHSYGLEVGNFNSGKVSVWTRLVNAGADYLVVPRPARAERWLR